MHLPKIVKVNSLMIALCMSTFLFASEGPQSVEDPGGDHLPDRIQTTFIENAGQISDSEIAFFANFLNGTVFVKRNGMLSYDFLPDEKNNLLVNEKFTTRAVTLVPLEPPPADIIAIYKQRGYSQAELANYYRMSLGEIYKGVELELRVFTDGLDKFLTLSSQSNPEVIQVALEGINGINVDKSGVLELTTGSGVVRFSKPYAFQVIDNERKPVEVFYRVVKDSVYGFKIGKYDKNKPLMIYYKTLKGEEQ